MGMAMRNCGRHVCSVVGRWRASHEAKWLGANLQQLRERLRFLVNCLQGLSFVLRVLAQSRGLALFRYAYDMCCAQISLKTRHLVMIVGGGFAMVLYIYTASGAGHGWSEC